MYSAIRTAIIRGIESENVWVEADVSNGMPMFEMVGFLSTEVKEARERVRTALRNCGYVLPPRRITINLSPGNIKKSGSAFDLPIAIAILAAMGVLSSENLENTLVLGEIGLNGQIQPVHGVLPIVAKAKEQGVKRCILPADNIEEANLIPDIEIWGSIHIKEVISWLDTGIYMGKRAINIEEIKSAEKQPDFSEINGQALVKRACEVAVAGMHNFMMIGSPGSGKTMIAERIPSILPSLTKQEQLELSKIYSVCGMFGEGKTLMNRRPFRSPHHTISPQGLAGGGAVPRPGEISLSHHGVLFLDELPEFSKTTLEILRQPLEERQINLVRLSGTYRYPADFMLVTALNPCPCGYYPDRNRCSCSTQAIEHYLGKISGPMSDRIDICVEATEIKYEELVGLDKGESSAVIQERVVKAQKIQHKRFKDSKITYNSRISSKDIDRYCVLTDAQKDYMREVYQEKRLSARGYHKILKVARTIADLAGEENILQKHLNEAVCYRSLDIRFGRYER